MKVLANRCYGGFSFSEEAVMLYAKRKGLTVYLDTFCGLTTYWTIPKENRGPYREGYSFYHSSPEERYAYNLFYTENTIDIHPCGKGRCDPDWVAVVEELGEKANGSRADLEVVEIPDDVNWEIEDYDGYETIREVSRTW